MRLRGSGTRLMETMMMMIMAMMAIMVVGASSVTPPVATTASSLPSAPGRIVWFAASQTILLQESGRTGSLWRSTDAGRSWAAASVGIPPSATSLSALVQHPYAKASTALLVTRGTRHWITADAGASWRPFDSPAPPTPPLAAALAFHAADPARIIMRIRQCDSGGAACRSHSIVTTDAFVSSRILLHDTAACVWAQSAAPDNPALANAVVCAAVWPPSSASAPSDPQLHLVRSDSLFEPQSNAVVLADHVAAVGNLFEWLVAVADPTAASISLLTSPEGHNFTRARFPSSSADASRSLLSFTILESSNASLFVDALSAPASNAPIPLPFGTLYKSDPDGSAFTRSLDHTNRDIMRGLVDFERVQAPVYDGILIANTVANAREIRDGLEVSKKLTTRMSFDNGARWNFITPPASDVDGNSWSCFPSTSPDTLCSLHLHSLTSSRNIGKIFSTVSAAGLLVGVGSVGSFLNPYESSDTFVSSDAGRTWTMVMHGPCKFEVIDSGAIIVLVPDSTHVDKVHYSTDRGATWQSIPITIDKGKSWTPFFTLSDPDAISQSMLISAYTGGLSGPSTMIHLDFSSVTSRKCDLDVSAPHLNRDLEVWKPLDGACLLGRRLGFYRVRSNAGCHLGLNLHDAVKPAIEMCSCSAVDYECDVDFLSTMSESNTFKCDLPSGLVLPEQPLDCVPGKMYKGRSGYRIIPGDVCSGGDTSLSKPVDRPCEKRTGGGGGTDGGGTGGGGGGSGGKAPVVVPDKNKPHVALETLQGRAQQIIYIPSTQIVLILTIDGRVRRSTDEGVTWATPDHITKLNTPVLRIALHESVSSRVFVFTDKDVYVSNYGLEGFKPFDRLNTPAPYNQIGVPIIDFHPTQPDWYVYVSGGRGCPDLSDCYTKSYITKDAGHTFELVDTWDNKCVWARDFGFADTSVDEDALICTSFKFKSGKVGQDELMYGNRDSSGHNPRQSNPAELVLLKRGGKDRDVLIAKDVADFYVIDGIMVVALSGIDAVGGGGSSSPSLAVSTDGIQFLDAKFPPNVALDVGSFTLLESDTGGIFLDIVHSNAGKGTLFKSNANGQFFSRILDNTHVGGLTGQVDFEKLSSIPGIAIANRVLATGSIITLPRVETVMSFDDGSTWGQLIAPEVDSVGNRMCADDSVVEALSTEHGQGQHHMADATTLLMSLPTSMYVSKKCHLHLHSVSSTISTVGSDFIRSTNASAGLVLAVGNTGPYLLPYNLGNVFLSRDAGRTWTEIRKDAHKWAIADSGGLLVLVNDEKPVTVLSYSWEYGLTWAELVFTDRPIRVEDVMTRPGTDSRRVIITGHYVTGGSGEHEMDMAVVSVNFEPLFERRCDIGSDFETWYPGESLAPTDLNHGSDVNVDQRCFFGEEVAYRRRKPDAVCFVGEGFSSAIVGRKPCACTVADYECDYNFFRGDGGKCELYGPDPKQPKSCLKGDTYKGSSGYRKIARSKCRSGVDLVTEKVDRVCGGRATGKVAMTAHVFDSAIEDFFYFNATSTVVVKDVQNELFISRNDGQSWEAALPAGFGPSAAASAAAAGKVVAILADPFFSHRAFFVTDKSHLVTTRDGGKTFDDVNLPMPPRIGLAPNFLSTHPDQFSWLIYIGGTDCVSSPGDCHSEAFVSLDAGKTWKRFATYVTMCQWIQRPRFHSAYPNGVLCMRAQPASGDQRSALMSRLIRYDDVHQMRDVDTGTELFDTTGFVVFENYLVSAVPTSTTDSRNVQFKVSLDAQHWATAVLPDDITVRAGYTVLESSTGSVFLHVIESAATGAEHGALLKSNWNGTFYTSILPDVNQNHRGYVDFEKLVGLRGVMISNQVKNADRLRFGETKRIQTQMSVDDGVHWKYLEAPKQDSRRQVYTCVPHCYLHLHAYTERRDPRDQYSSMGVTGMLIGVGNVGEYLTDVNEGDTFLSRDGGHTWMELVKEAHMVEVGDHGGVIVMVNDETYTDVIRYSVDGGVTVHDLKVSDAVVDTTTNGRSDGSIGAGAKVRVSNILTEPNGAGLRFIVLATMRTASGGTRSVSIQLDFSDMWTRDCVFDRKDPAKSDFEPWSLSTTSGGGTSADDACHFGTNTTYYRRKNTSECRIQSVYAQLERDVVPCACTLNDFECDVGYHADGQACLPDADTLARISNGDQVDPCGPGGIQQGYRLRGITQCVRPESVLPPSDACRIRSLTPTSWVSMILGSLAVSGLVTLAFVHYRNGGFDRLGRIRLPPDAGDDVSGVRTSVAWRRVPSVAMDVMGNAARVVGTVLIAGAAGIAVVGHRVNDWIKMRMSRAQGYVPVNTTATDPATRIGHINHSAYTAAGDHVVTGLGASSFSYGGDHDADMALDWEDADDIEEMRVTATRR